MQKLTMPIYTTTFPQDFYLPNHQPDDIDHPSMYGMIVEYIWWWSAQCSST